jgi:hypothetical protein
MPNRVTRKDNRYGATVLEEILTGNRYISIGIGVEEHQSPWSQHR